MGRMRRVLPRELPAKLREIRSRLGIRSKLGIGQAEMARKLQDVDESVYAGMISRYEHEKIGPSVLCF